MSGADHHSHRQPERGPASEVRQTTCCVVGGGPGGVVLALLLARKGVNVTLLESHKDFDRDFRGDTIHPSALELLAELGLVERLLRIRHSELHNATIMTPDGPVVIADFQRLKTKFPFIALLPQVDFLEFIIAEARTYPNFNLVMSALVEELVEEDGVVRGVRYRHGDEWHEVRAELTVGADGRGSRVRHLVGFEPLKTSPPMDILWFRLPRRPDDPKGLLGRFGRGHAVVLLDRLEQWQLAYVILKGSFQHVRAAGIEELQRALAETVPEVADRVEHLKDWKQVSMLSVESSRVRQWYLPGLLLIGDAAHVMSPMGGVGINYAIQDAVVAANVITAPLLAGTLKTAHLREVQRQREWPTRFIQALQTLAQKRVIATALDPNRQFRLPRAVRLLLRVPLLRDIPARLIAFGLRRVHLKQ